MNRRAFLKDSSVLAGAWPYNISKHKEKNQLNKSFNQAYVTLDQQKVSFSLIK